MLKPCPFCGGNTEVNITSGEIGGYIGCCHGCEISGPAGKTREEAEKFWNLRVKLPAGQQWTKELPTQPGWYWFLWTFGAANVRWIVQIVALSGGKLAISDGGRIYSLTQRTGEWAGPIPEPELP